MPPHHRITKSGSRLEWLIELFHASESHGEPGVAVGQNGLHLHLDFFTYLIDPMQRQCGRIGDLACLGAGTTPWIHHEKHRAHSAFENREHTVAAMSSLLEKISYVHSSHQRRTSPPPRLRLLYTLRDLLFLNSSTSATADCSFIHVSQPSAASCTYVAQFGHNSV
jgi:hypothetical protein